MESQMRLRIYLFCVLAVVAIYTTELVKPVRNIATESSQTADSHQLFFGQI